MAADLPSLASCWASLSSAFGLDYRAAAECQTVIHARNLDPEAMNALFARAVQLSEESLELPADRARIDQEIIESAQTLLLKVSGEEATPIASEAGAGDANAGGGAGSAGGTNAAGGGVAGNGG